MCYCPVDQDVLHASHNTHLFIFFNPMSRSPTCAPRLHTPDVSGLELQQSP